MEAVPVNVKLLTWLTNQQGGLARAHVEELLRESDTRQINSDVPPIVKWARCRWSRHLN